jgi:hypothetical protein
MANYTRNTQEKELLHAVIKLFTDNPVLRYHYKITDLEAEICKKVFIEEKLFNELEVPNKLKKSQIKEMAAAPFLKVINKVKADINVQYNIDDIAGKQIESIEIKGSDLLTDSMPDISLDEFNISERTRKILKENGISTIAGLSALDFDKLRFDKNYGVKTIFELQQLAGKLKDSRDILSIHRKTGKQ